MPHKHTMSQAIVIGSQTISHLCFHWKSAWTTFTHSQNYFYYHLHTVLMDFVKPMYYIWILKN